MGVIQGDQIENSPTAWSVRALADKPWEAAGWSEQGQKVRFRAVLEALAPRSGESLLDFGCGPGAFCELLDQYSEFGADGIDYVGYDWAPGMIERARRDHPSRRFATELPHRKFDMVACIGPFNLPDGWSKLATWQTLQTLWHGTTRRLVASLYAGDDDRCLIYDLDDLYEAGERLAGGNFTIESGYLPNDRLLVLGRR